MNRTGIFLFLALSSLSLLPASASAQTRQRCQFNMYGRVNVQMNFRPQQFTQPRQMMSNARMMNQPRQQPRLTTNLQQPRINNNTMNRSVNMVRRPATPSIMRTNTTLSRNTNTTFRANTVTMRTGTLARASGLGTGRVTTVSRPATTLTTRTSQTTNQLRRVTTTSLTRGTPARVSTTSSTRKETTSTQNKTVTNRRPATAPRTREQSSMAKAGRENQQKTIDKHSALVQARLRMGMVCGSCHTCSGSQPSTAQLPKRSPVQFAERKPATPQRPNMPFAQQRQQRPDVPFAQQRPQQPRPQMQPLHVARNTPYMPTLVRPSGPMPLAVLRAPVLPPMTSLTTRQGPKPTLTPFVVDRETYPTYPTPTLTTTAEPTPLPTQKPTLTMSLTSEPPLPALPSLDNSSIVELSPLLAASKPERVRLPAARDDLDPAAVTLAPALPPLAKALGSDLRLLPGLDGERLPLPPSQPSPLELARQAPPLPPLLESN